MIINYDFGGMNKKNGTAKNDLFYPVKTRY
jgi:hypothetical protein